jgi:hypothetical protein
MAVQPPVDIPFPLSTFPGQNPQESEGRLINSYVEQLGDDRARKFKTIRSAGLSQHAATTNSGYRGGLTVKNLAYECWSNDASTVDSSGDVTSIGPFPGTKPVSIAQNQASPVPDVVAVDLDNGAYVLGSAPVTAATATATIGGSAFNSGDIVTLDFLNPYLSPPFPVSVSHTLGSSESASTVAASLNTAINANATLAANNITSTVAGAVISISQQGSIGNQTSVIAAVTTGTETVTFVPASGDLTGGAGTVGAFVGGVPTLYTADTILPEPNSVCFQDGYFFFTIGSGQIYATGINSLSMNALTYITVQAKADVQLLRGVAFSGLLLAFTTGSCEVWQDAANPSPNFPYSRLAVLEFGLAQATAIAGWETGFSELLWVAQDFGVHWMTAGQLGQIKVSTSDLDRLIEAEIRAGNMLWAGVYIVSGKKFWVLASPDWTWEFNLQTQKWTERWSLTTAGAYGAWRALGGHPAFGKWLVGDAQSGNLLWPDDTNPTENGAPMLYRVESAPVKKFPSQQRVARADFDFVVGVGQAVGNVSTTVIGTQVGIGGVVRLEVISTARMNSGDVANVSGVAGTVEANGNWTISVVDATHLDLQATMFVNAYTSGGIVTDLTTTPNQQNPTVAVSMSKDGGLNWGNPLLRPLGSQGNALRTGVYVLNQGFSGTQGVRWRLDVTDAVFVSLMGGTMDSEMRPPGV